MFKKVVLAGLMTATLLGGIAPAYAQRGDEGRGQRGGERVSRPAGNAPHAGQRWQQRGNDRPAAAPVQQQPRAERQWRGNANAAAQAPNRQEWRGDRGPVRPVQSAQQQSNRQWRNNAAQIPGAADRRDWRNDRRDDNRDWRDDRRQDDRRRDDRRWNDARRDNWRGNNGAYDGRRYDDRTRWAGQRRWDNGWRQDQRYDWYGYRNRYGDRYRLGRYYAPSGWGYGYRSFSAGIFLSSLLYANNYWIDDPYYYRLPPAYGTLRWIRYYDDALLVDIRDGYVVDVIHDFFW